MNNNICILKWTGKNSDFRLYLIHLRDQLEGHLETALRNKILNG